MKIPTFTFDEGANGYLSEPMEIEEPILVKMELASRAPVVTLKQEEDGGWANYGQTPKDDRRYEITIRPKEKMTIMLATPVKVLKCHVV